MKIRRNIRSTSEPNLSSSSDIAFLLIIFFMVTSAFIFKDGINMILPAKSKEPKKIENAEEISVITVDNEKIQLNKKEIELDKLKETIIEKLKEEPEHIVLLKFNKDTVYQKVISLIDTMRQIDVQKLSVKMVEEEK